MRSNSVERIQAFLCATSIIEGEDELFTVASWTPAADGEHRVYSIDADDWGLHALHPSLTTLQVGERLSRQKLDVLFAKKPPAHDPLALFERVDWLLNFFLFAFRDFTINNWDSLKHAPKKEVLRRELGELQRWPHLAVYWLWASFLFDEEEQLAAVKKAVARSPFAAVTETLKLIARPGRALASKVAQFRAEALFPKAPPKREASTGSVANARKFVKGWQHKSADRHRQAFVALTSTDTPEARDLIIELLDTVDYSVRWHDNGFGPPGKELAEAVIAAGRLRLKAARAGIEKAITHGLDVGNDSPTRAKLIRALFLAAGDSAFTFLDQLYRAQLARQNDLKPALKEDLVDLTAVHHYELSCLLAGLVLMRPEDSSLRRAFEAEWKRSLALKQGTDVDYFTLAALTRAVQLGSLEVFHPLVRQTVNHTVKPCSNDLKTLADDVRRIAKQTLDGIPCP